MTQSRGKLEKAWPAYMKKVEQVQNAGFTSCSMSSTERFRESYNKSQKEEPHLQKVYVVCAEPREAPVHAFLHLLRCDPRLLPILSEILVAIPGHLTPQKLP